jgi:hypothetical protein
MPPQIGFLLLPRPAGRQEERRHLLWWLDWTEKLKV